MDLKNKVVNFLGDSITEGRGVEDIEHNRYDNRIKEMCQCKRVNNYGVSGTRIAYQRTPSQKSRYDYDFCMRCWDMDPEADVIVVYGGVNDYNHGDAPLGQIGDTSRSTFCGAVDYLCKKINELYPKAVHVFMVPAHKIDDDKLSTDPVKPLDAEKRILVEYVDKIKVIAKQNNFHVLSLWDELPINPNNPDDCAKYTVDGLHFNAAGHKVIAETLVNFLSKI